MNDIILFVFSSMFGAGVGFAAAMQATRYSEQVAAVNDFKRVVVRHMRILNSQSSSSDSSISEIKECLRELYGCYILCNSALSKRPSKRLAVLWQKFYREDDGGDLQE